MATCVRRYPAGPPSPPPASPFGSAGPASMNSRKWRDVRANARELGLWRGGIPATPEEAETFHVVMKKAQEEEDEEKLSELLAQAARQGRSQR